MHYRCTRYWLGNRRPRGEVFKTADSGFSKYPSWNYVYNPDPSALGPWAIRDGTSGTIIMIFMLKTNGSDQFNIDWDASLDSYRAEFPQASDGGS